MPGGPLPLAHGVSYLFIAIPVLWLVPPWAVVTVSPPGPSAQMAIAEAAGPCPPMPDSGPAKKKMKALPRRQKVHGHVRPTREASKPPAVPVAKAPSKAKALLRRSSRSRGRRAHLHHVPRQSCCFLLRHCKRCGSVRPSLRCCLRARVPPRVQGGRRPALGMHHSLELFGSALIP